MFDATNGILIKASLTSRSIHYNCSRFFIIDNQSPLILFYIQRESFNIQYFERIRKNHIHALQPAYRKYILFPNDNAVTSCLINGSIYEPYYFDFISDNLISLDGMTIIDVGANSGIYSLQVGKNFPDVKIVSFEPVKETFLKFKKNILLNKNIRNIKAYNLGLSDQNQSLEMKALKKNGYIQQGGFGVVSQNENTLSPHTEFALFKKGDEQFDLKNNIIFIKIDVEGHELSVLNGMAELISNNNIFMQVEIFDHLFEKTNNFLNKNNFKIIHKIFSDGKTDYYYKNF